MNGVVRSENGALVVNGLVACSDTLHVVLGENVSERIAFCVEILRDSILVAYEKRAEI